MGSHVALEAQRDMAGSLCDMARSFWGFWNLGTRATSRWRPNTTWRAPYATWRTRFALFLGDLDPWISSHVVLEAQHDMAGSQYDVARSFCSLSGGFGPLDLEPRRVGGLTRHGGLPMRRGALVLLSFGGIRTLGSRATSRWRPNTTWRGPNTTWQGAIQCDAPFSRHFNKKATSELSQRWQALFLLFGFLFA